jgi:hypothetical protein
MNSKHVRRGTAGAVGVALALGMAMGEVVVGVPSVSAQTVGATVEWNFEEGSTNSWGPWFSGGTVRAVPSGGRVGPGALRADTNALVQTTAPTPGVLYGITAYMKPLALPKSRGAEVQVYDTANNAVTLPLRISPEADGWLRVSGRITLGAQTRLVLVGFDAGGVSFLLDDVRIAPIDPTDPPEPPVTAAPTVPSTRAARPATTATVSPGRRSKVKIRRTRAKPTAKLVR